MKKLIIIALLCFAAIAEASGEFAVVELCQDGNSYRLSLRHDADYAMRLSPSHSAIQILFGETAYIPLRNKWVELRSEYPEPSMTELLFLENVPLCATASAPMPVLHNECLGIAPNSLNLPDSGVFTVDGIEYPYSGNLSFLVPDGMAWTWELWHEGQYILSFTQDETTPCHIVGSD